MKVVQRDTQLITCDTKGDLVGEFAKNHDISISIDKTKKYSLFGMSVMYEYDANFINGSEIKFEVRDFFVIDFEGESAEIDFLYKQVVDSANNSYEIMCNECRKNDKKSPRQPKLKKDAILHLLAAELIYLA